jgi:hypothetical protein
MRPNFQGENKVCIFSHSQPNCMTNVKPIQLIRINQMNAKMLVTGAALALALSAAVAIPGVALAKVVNLTPAFPGTISGVVDPYLAGKVVKFNFTIAPKYSFVFTETGTGGDFPFPISITSSGGAGSYTETFGPVPVHGVVDYTLTTAIPEPASWALMIVGFGVTGASMRRRVRIQSAA